LTATLALGISTMSTQIEAQSADERKAVVESADAESLRRLSVKFQADFERQEALVIAYLKKHPDTPRSFEKNGSTHYLKRIDDDGNPVYINTKNTDNTKHIASTRSANADREPDGGSR